MHRMLSVLAVLAILYTGVSLAQAQTTPPTPPPVPMQTITLAWDAALVPTGGVAPQKYYVYYSEAPATGGSDKEGCQVPATVLTCTVTVPQKDSTLYFTAWSWYPNNPSNPNAGENWSRSSNKVSVVLKTPVPAIGAPRNLSATVALTGNTVVPKGPKTEPKPQKARRGTR